MIAYGDRALDLKEKSRDTCRENDECLLRTRKRMLEKKEGVSQDSIVRDPVRERNHLYRFTWESESSTREKSANSLISKKSIAKDSEKISTSN